MLSAVADERRLRLLKCLQVRPACVCELVQATGLSQSCVSRHLATLRETDLVKDERDAQWVIYRIAEPAPGTPQADLLELVASWGEDDPQMLEDRKRLRSASRDQTKAGART